MNERRSEAISLHFIIYFATIRSRLRSGIKEGPRRLFHLGLQGLTHSDNLNNFYTSVPASPPGVKLPITKLIMA